MVPISSHDFRYSVMSIFYKVTWADRFFFLGGGGGERVGENKKSRIDFSTVTFRLKSFEFCAVVEQ